MVQTHRDPVKVLASVASLTGRLHAIFSESVDREAIGAEVAARWRLGVSRSMRARDALGASKRFFDVHYTEPVRDPIDVVRRIYAYFERPISAAALARMRRFLAEHPESKHGSHDYELSDWGLEAAAESERFSRYGEYFGVAAEVAV